MAKLKIPNKPIEPVKPERKYVDKMSVRLGFEEYNNDINVNLEYDDDGYDNVAEVQMPALTMQSILDEFPTESYNTFINIDIVNREFVIKYSVDRDHSDKEYAKLLQDYENKYKEFLIEQKLYDAKMDNIQPLLDEQKRIKKEKALAVKLANEAKVKLANERRIKQLEKELAILKKKELNNK